MHTHTHTHTHTHFDIGIGTVGVPLLQALVGGGGGFLSFLYTFFTGGGGELRELPRGGVNQGCGRVFFLLSRRCCFSCNKNYTNENDHFTTCRCAMLCCAVLWCVSIGPCGSPFNFIAPSYQF